MLSNSSSAFVYKRPPHGTLVARLGETRRFIQVVTGPRQVGKTTLVRQALADLEIPSVYASADDPGLRDRAWLDAQWGAARAVEAASAGHAAILAIDEVQKVGSWAEIVKRLWDEDAAAGVDVRVVLLGSAPLLVQRGLTESLAGRFETIRLTHWSFGEMESAFGWDLETFLVHGGYPGAAVLVDDPERWRAYLLDSLVETTLARDVLLLHRIDKPALLRQLFRLGCDYSGQVVSYQKLVGQLQDAGNTTTLAHYLRILGDSGLLTGLEKYSGGRIRQRGSSPKLLALDSGLMTAMAGLSRVELRDRPEDWGRVVETAVGAHLVNSANADTTVSWWRDRDREVDFVVESPHGLMAMEVGSGRRKPSLPGLAAFSRAYPNARVLLAGAQGMPLADLLRMPAHELVAATTR
ncbi:MAG: ATP-binding protein [Chloroflexota bacterium]